MTRTRKWMVGIVAAIGILVVALLAALAWLLYTPSGLRFALDRGVAAMHGQFTYASASGTLAGEATIEGLRYRDESGDRLRIRQATLALQPWALLGKRLHVGKARIDGIEVTLTEPQQPGQSGAFSLQPPLTVILDDVLLTHIRITRDQLPVFAADSLAIAGRWTSRRLQLTRFVLRSPDGSADLAGTLGFTRGYRGQGKANIDWRYQGTRYVAELTTRSDGRTATLHGTVTSPVKLDVEGTLALDKRHGWTLAVQAPRFDARALPMLPASIQTLAVDLKGAGDASGGKLDGKVVANEHTLLIDPLQFRYDGKTLTLDPLRLRAPDVNGIASVTGAVHLDHSPIDAVLDARWRDVQLPADLAGQELATHGDLHVEGSAEHFAVTGALAVGPPGRLADIQLDLAGTPQAIELKTLKLVQDNGGLDAHGSVQLQPQTAWQIEAVAKRFDPGAIIAGWDGAMDFDLATEGTLTPDGPQASIKLSDVAGKLRGRSIAGSKADLEVRPGNLLDGSLLLVMGNSRVLAEGSGGDRTNADVSIDVASLNDWMPGASGSLHGKFHVAGKWPALDVRGQMRGDKLVVSGNRVDTLQLQASIPDVSKPGGDFDLALAGVHISALDFDTVKLVASGNQASHKASLDARGPQLGVALSLQGSWQAKTRRWSGTLSGAELTPQGMPSWRQQQTSPLTWQDGAATLGQFCLSAGEPELCLEGNRNAKGVIQARYSLQRLPLQLLASLAGGADPLQASGEISGSGQLAIDAGAINGNASLAATPGKIAYASHPDRTLLAWTSLEADLDATGNRQQLRLQGNLADGGRIAGDVQATGAERALQGSIDVDLRSLAFLEALSPEIANVQGDLNGRLTLAGTLAAPQFQGSIQTRGFSAELPRAGLKLHDGTIGVVGDQNGQLRIQGQVASGKGVLQVAGSAGLSADQPLALDIKGENVLVADIPAARVVASPDLHIGRDKGVFTLTGSVAIPSASIEADKLPGQGPAQASPDVVIVDNPEQAEVAPMAMNGDIEVKLGDDVKVTGYGLDGKVRGSLAVRVRPEQVATGRGEISVSGKYQAYGQDLSIERGRLLFAGTRLDNPGLDIRAVRNLRSQDVTVGLSVRGTAQRPILTVFSDPPMEQAEALSYLVTGRPLDSLKSGEGDTLNTAAQALGGLAGDRLAKSIGSRLGLEAGVSSSEALGGSAFTAGKYLSPRLYLSYGVGLFTPGQVITLRYTLNRFLQFEAENATTGNRASFNYRIEK